MHKLTDNERESQLFTRNLIDGVRGLERLPQNATKCAEKYDPAYAEICKDVIAPKRLRKVAAFAVALADAFEAKEKQGLNESPGAPYTPETLADHWQCTPQLVYRLLKNGHLRGFKLGGKLWRISAYEVAQFERGETAVEADNKKTTIATNAAIVAARLAWNERKRKNSPDGKSHA